MNWALKLENEAGLCGIPTDVIPTQVSWNMNWLSSLEGFNPVDDSKSDIIYLYTDGSKIKDQIADIDRVGCGIVITQADSQQHHTPILADSYYLGTSASVFQAEIMAIHYALEAFKLISIPSEDNLLKYGDLSATEICIVTDSKAAIRALGSFIVKSSTVSLCKSSLNSIAQSHQVSIKWIKAHAGFAGNELADIKAKNGALSPSEGPEPFIPAPGSWFKQKITSFAHKTWSDRWRSSLPCRQTKIFFPVPDIRISKHLLRLSRDEFGLIFRWLSGHNFLRRHNHLLDPARFQSSLCRMCNLEEETSSHIILNCPALGHIRFSAFGYFILPPSGFQCVRSLLKFISDERISILEEFPFIP